MAVSGACPNCGGQFVELDRAGVRIDACRNCRGVWLDRGELETLVEREQRVVAGAAHDEEDFIREITGRKQHGSHGGSRHHEDDDHYDAHKAQRYGLDVNTAKRIFEGYSSHKTKHKRKSLLDELLG